MGTQGKFRRFIILTSVLLLAACAGGTDHAGLTPTGSQDPDDAAMRESVTAFLQQTGAPVSSMYDFQRIDLDHDGRRDALVLFKNPYGYWCDQNGCTMLVMHAGEESFELVNAIQPVRGPLYVSSAATNGWRDIILHVGGRWSATRDVAMTYNGAQYPRNPDVMPPYLLASSANAQRVFY
jgi:hypothetical protein